MSAYSTRNRGRERNSIALGSLAKSSIAVAIRSVDRSYKDLHLSPLRGFGVHEISRCYTPRTSGAIRDSCREVREIGDLIIEDY